MTFWQLSSYIKGIIIGICLCGVHGTKAEVLNQSKAPILLI